MTAAGRPGLEQLVDASMLGSVDEVERLGEELVGGDVAVEQDDGPADIGALECRERSDSAAGERWRRRHRVGTRLDLESHARRPTDCAGPASASRTSKSTDSTVQPCCLEHAFGVVVGGGVAGPAGMAVGVPVDEGVEVPFDGGDERLRHVMTTLLRGRGVGRGPSALDGSGLRAATIAA